MTRCQYYYNEDDATIWWDLVYHEALEVKKELCQKVIDELCNEHFLKRDSERINRCLKHIRELEAQLGEKHK